MIGIGTTTDRVVSWVAAGLPDCAGDCLVVLQWDTEAVGQAIDEIEVPGDLTNVQDRRIGPARVTKQRDVARFHGFGRTREFVRIAKHGPLGIQQIGLLEVRRDLFGELIVPGECAQTARMMDHSVVTLIGRRDREGDHLPLCTAQL